MGLQEALAEYNHLMGEVRGLPEEAPDTPEGLRAVLPNLDAVATRIACAREMIEELDEA